MGHAGVAFDGVGPKQEDLRNDRGLAQSSDRGRAAVCLSRWHRAQAQLGRRGAQRLSAGCNRRERERLSGDSRHLRGGEGGQDGLERVPQASQGTRIERCPADHLGCLHRACRERRRVLSRGRLAKVHRGVRKIFKRTVESGLKAKIATGEIVHIDSSLIRANVSWDSLVERHVADVLSQNQSEEETEVERKGRQSGKYKKVCTTDPDATMATNARNRRLEPAYKQHAAVDDKVGVILDVVVTTGHTNEGEMVEQQEGEVKATSGIDIKAVTADAGYAYAKVYGALERRDIDALIPTKAEPIRSPVPLRRFRYDAKNDIVKCPRGKVLRPGNPVGHGRFFYARKRDCQRCSLASICVSKGRTSKGIVISHDYPALLRARRRRERWSKEDQQLYQRHRWRSEGFHGEAKTWHGLARAVRRGLANMKIQAYLTAAAINLKRLAAALLALLLRWIVPCSPLAFLRSLLA